MKLCTHCGKELFDEAVICPGCGCAVGDSPASGQADKPESDDVNAYTAQESCQPVNAVYTGSAPVKTKKKGKTILLFSLIGAFLVAAAVVVIFVILPNLPKTRDITLHNLHDMTPFEAKMFFGKPSYISEDEDTGTPIYHYDYDDTVPGSTFYGVKIETFIYESFDHSITMLFSRDNRREATKFIERYAHSDTHNSICDKYWFSNKAGTIEIVDYGTFVTFNFNKYN